MKKQAVIHPVEYRNSGRIKKVNSRSIRVTEKKDCPARNSSLPDKKTGDIHGRFRAAAHG